MIASLTKGGRPLRVLVAEDEALIAADVEMTLAEFGVEVLAVTTFGEDVIRLASALQPDVVVMDIWLAGEVDGVDAAATILKMSQSCIVFVSGNADAETFERIRRLGRHPFVHKPIEPADLETALKEACRLD